MYVQVKVCYTRISGHYVPLIVLPADSVGREGVRGCGIMNIWMTNIKTEKMLEGRHNNELMDDKHRNIQTKTVQLFLSDYPSPCPSQ